tara:strand:+ start:87 stop:620 length:534 start_codon:yes stop_codon:yes gene_type:complete
MNLKKTNEALNKFGKYVVQQSKTNLTKDKKGGGSLYNSVRYDLDQEQNAFLLDFLMNNYGTFQDLGVKGSNPSLVKNGKQKAPNSPYSYKSKMPPLKPLMNWAKMKKIRFRDKEGKFKRGNYKSIGFWLQKRIFAQGLKPSLFFTKPFNKAFANLPTEVINAFAIDIEKSIVLGVKK